MNKIYKLIWSKTKNCLVVASELAKGYGKNKSRIKNSLLAIFVMSALLAGGVADVQALTQQEKEEVKNEVAKYLLDKIAHGGEISGVDATRGPTNFPDAIANRIFYYNDISSKIGEKLKKDGLTLRYFGVRPDYIEPSRDYLERYANKDWTNVDNDGAFGAHSMALGYRAFSEAKHGVAIGRSALAGGSLWKGDYGGDGGVAIGNHAWALGDKSVSVGNAARAVHKGIAIGIQAEAGLDENDNTTDWSTAPGFTPKQGKSIQYDPKTKLPYVTSDIRDKMGAIAIGIDAKAHGNHSTAMGVGAKAKSRYAWSFGYSSEASGVGSIAFGSRATAKGTNAIAIGSGNYDQPNGGAQAYSEDTIAIGRGSVAGNKDDTATAYNSIAVGREARAYGKNSIALGGTANVGDIWQKQLADGGTAIGSSSNAALENATAIGYKSIAYGKDAVTLGANTRADIDGGVALGSDSNVGSYASPSYGKAGKVGYDPLGTDADETSTWKATKAAVSVGNQQKDITRQIINVAAGTDNTDAVNVAQLKTLGRKAWKDLAEAKDQLGARIATNTTSITALSGKVRTNTQDIGRLKTDVNTNDRRIRYLYDNMPFMHYVSVNEGNTNKTTDNRKNDGAKKVGSIAIGVNTHAYGEDAVALGGNSFVRGQGSVIVGESSDNYTGGLAAKEGQFDQSVILGSNNTIFAQSAENGGREDKIIGNMNRVEESHGTFVRGTGNFVYDAYNDEALTDEDKQKEQDFLDPIDGGDPTGLFQKGRSHVTVEGDGNLVGGALYTRVSGVGNEVSNSQPDENGPSTPRVSYNIVTGNRNTVVDSNHNLIMGDNHELENVNGNIIIGSMTTKAKTEASNVTVLGNDANVSVEGGVALGTGSVASTAAEVAGYDPLTGEASANTTSTWKSGNGAVSVGTADKTRQITNLAAGTQDTDAVNVAQLKSSKTAVEAGDYVTVTKKTEDGKGTTYTVKGPKLTSEDTNLKVTDEVDAGKKVGYKLQLSKTLTGLTSVTSDAFKVGDKTYINSKGINANNNKITNVAAGAADGDAVNFKQLSDVKTKVEANEGNITLNKNAIAGLTPKVTANTTNITKLQAGFTVKDGGTGSADVTLGGDTKQEVTFKAAVDKTTQATENGSSLTSTVGTDRSVTYKLNMKQLKKDLGITEGTDGVMSSWKLQAKGDTTPQDIKNGEAVTFDVAAADKGLTVAREGKTIKYGIDGSKIDISNNQSITNLGKRIDNLDPIHYFSVNSTDKGAGSNYKNDGAKKDGSIAIGPSALNNGNQSVAVGLKSKVEDGWWSVALGTESKTNGHFTTAIGYQASATKLQSLALGTMAEAAAESGISIGVKAKSLANRGIALGTNSTVGATGGRGIAIGDGSYVGAKTNNHPGTGMSNPGDEWKPANPYVTADDDTVAGPGKLPEENSMAIGMKASAFGFQTTALGAGAEAHNTNTTAVGVAAVAKGNYSTALGKQARTFEKESTSVGHWADSRAEFATSVGANTIVYKKGGVALGSGARAYDENSVAIGSNSFAKEAIDGKAYLSDEDVKAAAGIVSVGSPNYKVGDTDVAANYRRIVNVAGGIHDNDAVNVAQLKAARTTVEAGDYVTVTSEKKAGVDGTVYTVKGPKLASKDSNLAVTDDEETVAGTTAKKKVGYKLELSKTLTGLTSVSSTTFKAGDNVTLGTTGLSITGGPSVTTTGIDAGKKKITNVADGDVSATSTDAVNGKQLNDVKTKVETNETNIGKLQAGFTVKDGGTGKADVTLGGDTKQEVIFKADVDKTTEATANGSSLTSSVDKDRKVTYKLNMKQLKQDLGITDGPDGVMSSWKLKVKDETTPQDIKNGEAVTFDATGAGLTVTRDGKTIKYGIDGSKIDIVNNQSITGLQNDIKNAKTTVEAGDYVTVTSEKKAGVDGTVYTVKGPKLTSEDTNLAVTDEEETVAGTTDKKKVGYKLELSKTLTGLTSVSSTTFKAGDNVTLGTTGLTITDGPSVTTTGIDAGKKKITNVADGDVSATSTDAVNGKQLNDVKTKVENNEENITELQKGWTLADADANKKIVKADNTVTVTGDDYINATVSDAGLKLGMDETKLNKQINNQIDNSTTVTNKMNSWVLKAATTDKDPAAKGQTIDNDNKVATFDVEKEEQGLTVARDGATIKYGVDKAKLAKHITGDVITNINDGSTAVTNISAKFSVTDGTNTKAVNLGKDKNNNVKFLGTAGETTVTVGGSDDAPTVTVGLDPEFKKQVNANSDNIAANKKAIDKNAGDIKTNTDNIAANKKAIDKNAGDIKTNTDNIAANKKAIDKNTKAIADKMTSWKLKAGGVDGEAEIKDGNAVTFDVAEKDQGLTVTRDGSTIKYGIEGSKIDISENKTVKELREEAKKHTSVVAGDYTTVTESKNEAGGKKYTVTGPSVKTDNNLTVQDIMTGDKKTGYTIGLAKDLKDLNSVSAKTVNADTVSAKTVNTDTVKASDKVTVGDKVTLGTTGLTIEKGPSVTTAGIDAGKQKITNVAAGAVSEKSTDAVNGGQLFGVEQKVNINNQNISILGGKVIEVNNRVNRVGAGAASLAALHPLDFDPDDKWDFAAGYGNYKGANAVAIGAYYRPNEDTMFSVGGSFGGGENMVNAGVSVKLGQGNHVTTSRVAMAKEIKDLRAEVEVLRQAVTGIGQGQTPDPVKMKLFPDIAKNHWAYEAVEELTKQGLLEGYPDGTFGGDRMMTRYEFAEIVYRAIQKGLNVNEKLVQEFEPELERFRIDVITKDKDGNPVIERIRVNEKKKAK